MIRRLHEVTADMLALEELLIEAGGEVTPEVEALMAEMEGNLEAKVDGYAALIREWELDAEKWEAEEARCASHRRARENAAKSLKARLVGAMLHMDRLKVETPRFKVAVQRAAATVEVCVPDAAWLPEHLQRRIPATIEADKAAIRDAMKATGTDALLAENGEAYARLIPGSPYLRIR